jgi:hypothetical protein
MQNKSFTSSLQRSTHFLSVGGDLRSRYVPWDLAGSGNPGYSYLKCEAVTNTTKVEFVLTNQGTLPAQAALSTALIKQDADLYALAADNPNVTPPVWAAPPAGSGGVVTVAVGGTVGVQFTSPTSAGGGQETLVVRVLLTGAPVKVEAWTPGTCEMY